MIAASCPPDVLLEVTKPLEVWDITNFIATCIPFRALRLERTLWMRILRRLCTVHLQPLPIPRIEDLDALSPDELARIARRAGRLLQKFRANQALQDPPQPVSIRKLFIEKDAKLVCIEGTYLALEHALGIVRCWNVLTGSCVAELAHPHLSLIPAPPCMDLKGKVLIGGFLGESWAVITIDYSDRSRIKAFHVVSPPLLPELHTHASLTNSFFITSQLMGCAHDSNIITWSMNAGDSVQLAVHQNDATTLPSASHGVCMAFGPNLYVLHPGARNQGVGIRRLPLPANANGAPAAPHTMTLPVAHTAGPGGVWHSTIATFVAAPPLYGVFAVTHKSFYHRKNLLHFWPLRAPTPHVLPDPLAFDAGYAYDHQQPFVKVAVGRSGTYVVVLVQVVGEWDEPDFSAAMAREHQRDGTNDVGEPYEGRLDLLHFSATPVPQVTCRRLDTGDVNPWGSHHLALDESLGLVFLVGNEREVTVISYL
ncbi:hypothetical protein C8R46DRAFT_1354083 [Mycena filopes]|nr:hypothetical protein C8R46DRAFT_1354083 [Mycena filopes]